MYKQRLQIRNKNKLPFSFSLYLELDCFHLFEKRSFRFKTTKKKRNSHFKNDRLKKFVVLLTKVGHFKFWTIINDS